MDRRSLLTLLAGVALGWTGATVVDGDDSRPDSDGDTDAAGGGTPNATSMPDSATEPTADPTATAESTAPPTETPEQTATPTAEPTATQSPTTTPSPTPDPQLRRNLDVYSRGFEDSSSYKVLYSIRNENDVTVSVTFEATVTLENGETLRKRETATIDPGQAVNHEFVFEGYESSPSGYGFQLLDATRA